MPINALITQLNPKKLFLIDFIGAIVSAISLGIILPKLQAYIGMPLNVLYLLAIIPVFFFIYSFYAYLYANTNWKPYLRFIAIANFLYCCLTFCLLIFYKNEVTFLGVGYFILEIIIVILLAFVEYRRSVIA